MSMRGGGALNASMRSGAACGGPAAGAGSSGERGIEILCTLPENNDCLDEGEEGEGKGGGAGGGDAVTSLVIAGYEERQQVWRDCVFLLLSSPPCSSLLFTPFHPLSHAHTRTHTHCHTHRRC